ncbi:MULTISPECIES: maleylpyruvate isomerase N-terminal domain-containing protein [Hyphomicrobiales]|uniref:Maleylpyruvate isomerase n=1 Tax=Pseudaminobacter salicylatoxidans TaxID=93369 RepID=A0A316BW84_PSESE|nr:maleylpyruvate isomerase N-terminal domain-containing protein [Pseudaminobacter salicylatoxidans]NTZ64109.1 maleylpyruvate isomerase [Agrobacterium tumefaciens]PWJ76356.1 maleylpyruvate isomerase [Pseudaminobacter salicylatoxidans]UXT00382.1 maleylpyruvate isomerase [Agrobacterium tumefaciens]
MSLAETDLAAREALKARQGKGARYDAPNAPAEDLLLARRGTAHFARKLMELPDAELYAPSAVEGLTRAHVVARIGYDARHQALALEAFGKGEIYTLPVLEEQQLPSLDLAATLPARALRHLFQHSEVHLNVCWRDLTEEQWDREVVLVDGTTVPTRALPGIRAAAVWQGALDLGNGMRDAELPAVALLAAVRSRPIGKIGGS